MARTASTAGEYLAKISDDNGTVRGKIPSPFVRDIGARKGDKLSFKITGGGQGVVTLVRGARGRKSTKDGGKKR